MTDYKDWQVQQAPPWLQQPMGTNWLTAQGLLKDSILEAMKRAVGARFYDFAPPDGLDHVGKTFDIERAYAADDNKYRTQLAAAWATWQQAGTAVGLSNIIKSLGYTNVIIAENGVGSQWFQFTVVLQPPFPWTMNMLADGLWQDAGNLDDGGTWAFAVPDGEDARIGRTIRKYKGAHTYCVWVVYYISGELWGYPSGNWGDAPGVPAGDTGLWGGVASYIGI